jgi:N-acetylmuramoyl-L-alanine amidase
VISVGQGLRERAYGTRILANASSIALRDDGVEAAGLGTTPKIQLGSMQDGVMRLIRQSLIIGLLAWLAAGPGWLAAAAGPQVLVSDARIGQHANHTRFVLAISGDVKFDVFTLADPYRIVIDFPEVAFRLDPMEAKGLIKGYRFGLYRPGRSRMVIDLTGPAVIANKFLLPPEGERGYRLVLDLTPTDRIGYLATAGWPKDEADAAAAEEPEIDEVPDRPANAKRVVVIDAGHGGVDPGATGVDGTYEKDIVLPLAKALRDVLERTGKYTVVMTRDSDIFLSLKARVAVGRRSKADLFVSLHADSAPDSYVRGASVYTLSEKASDKEAEALARSENQSDIIAGVDLTNESDVVTSILIDLAQRETKNSAVKFAQVLVPELQRAGDVTQKSHKFAGFRVLKAPDVPSVLIEVGYVSNQLDESSMATNRWRRGMAGAISRAIDRYFKESRLDHKVEAEP